MPAVSLTVSTYHADASDVLVTASVEGWLPAIRAAAPTSQIFLCVPFGGFKLSALQNAFSAYQSAHMDNQTHFVDLGSEVSLLSNFSPLPLVAHIHSLQHSIPSRALSRCLNASYMSAFSSQASHGTSAWGATAEACDGIHPLASRHAQLGAMLAARAAVVLSK